LLNIICYRYVSQCASENFGIFHGISADHVVSDVQNTFKGRGCLINNLTRTQSWTWVTFN